MHHCENGSVFFSMAIVDVFLPVSSEIWEYPQSHKNININYIGQKNCGSFDAAKSPAYPIFHISLYFHKIIV